MFTLWGNKNRTCDGISRRSFLQAGALGLGGLSLADVLRLRAQAPSGKKPRAVIMVVLAGGPSHIDMYDLKPNATSDYRGEFKPIKSNVPGFEICEHMPLQAQIADKLALVRTVQFVEPMQHELQEVYSGFTKAAARPSFGSVISRFRGGDPRLPSYVTLDYGVAEYEGPKYLGAAHYPLSMGGNGGAGAADLKLAYGVSRVQMENRRELLNSFDTMRKDLDIRREGLNMDTYTARAIDIVSSARARDAFDLNREPDRVRRRYGSKDDKYTYVGKEYESTWEGDKFLLARRLVEAGVSVVTLRVGSWDHHGNVIAANGGVSIWYSLKSVLPHLDRSIHALVTDLHERGLDEEVAVLVWGEMGRTPRITQAGRDHWMDASYALFAGGGMKMGQVIGETDSNAVRPKNRPLGPQNVLATIYHTLGINPEQSVNDFAGRPQYLLDDREPITELVG